MKYLKPVCFITALFLLSGQALYAKGPKGGPSFETYQWTEVRPTQFFDPFHW